MSKPLPGTDPGEDPTSLQPIIFEVQMLRAALEKQVSEKIGAIVRDLRDLAEKVTKPANGESLNEAIRRKKENEQKILMLVSDASSKFFKKMRERINSQYGVLGSSSE